MNSRRVLSPVSAERVSNVRIRKSGTAVILIDPQSDGTA
jgi:hypothetical protein